MSHWDRSIEQIREEVESADMTRSDLLREVKEALREVRLSLPLYRSIQEPRRYQITLDDIEDAAVLTVPDLYRELFTARGARVLRLRHGFVHLSRFHNMKPAQVV